MKTTILGMVVLLMGLAAAGAALVKDGGAAVQPVALTADERSNYAGGAPVPAVWQMNKLCTAPTGATEKAASECNKDDTSCSAGTAYCAQQGAAGLNKRCADWKSYWNPLECVSRDTTLKCRKNVNAAEVDCYTIQDCFCKFNNENGGTYTCGITSVPNVPDTRKILPCEVE